MSAGREVEPRIFTRVVVAFLLIPFVPALLVGLVLTVVLVVPSGWTMKEFGSHAQAAAYLFGASWLLSCLVTLLLGLPAYLLLASLGWVTPVSLALAGGSVALLLIGWAAPAIGPLLVIFLFGAGVGWIFWLIAFWRGPAALPRSDG